jgi:hypothetical protein
MPTTKPNLYVVKKRDAERYQTVARRYRVWLRRHPQATRRERVEMFDSIADAECNGEGN